jgi:division protein CdvB (Snf7/Vps24/ESCRT-III family)
MDANTTIVISLVTLVLAIFGASWLNQRQTEKFLEQIEKKFDAKFEIILSEIKRVDNRIDNFEKRMDNRLENIEKRLDRVERQLETLFKPALPK